MWTRSQLKQQAKQSMRLNYKKMLLVSFIVLILSGDFFRIIYNFFDWMRISDSSVLYEYLIPDNQKKFFTIIVGVLILISIIYAFFSIAYTIFVTNILQVGNNYFYIQTKKGTSKVRNLFYPFRNNYWNCLKIMALVFIKILLWSLLLIIPGIIKSYEYFMIPYILAEQPDISSKEAFELSKKMTDGEKMEIFILDLTFLGWQVLGVFVFFVGIVFVRPYIEATYVELYYRLKEMKHIQLASDLPNLPN